VKITSSAGEAASGVVDRKWEATIAPSLSRKKIFGRPSLVRNVF